jgi:hypothetical protein
MRVRSRLKCSRRSPGWTNRQCEFSTELALSEEQILKYPAKLRCSQRRLFFRLRFVAAVSVSCSGDKPDKEESAGGFRCYGDCGAVRWFSGTQIWHTLRADRCATSDLSGRILPVGFILCGRGTFAALVLMNWPQRLVRRLGGGTVWSDGWIMRLPPMAVLGIAEVDRAGRFR